MASVDVLEHEISPVQKKIKRDYDGEIEDNKGKSSSTVYLSDSDCEGEGDGCRHMTREEYSLYVKQCSDSDGFDVDEFPGTSMYGQIMKVNFQHSQKETRFLEYCSDLAIKDYCRNNARAHYTFEKVLKANAQCTSGLLYYITFEARNANPAADNPIDVFQAKVLYGVVDEVVQSCRLKPTN